MVNRRVVIVGAAIAPLAFVGRRLLAGPGTFETSKLIYVTPIKSDGEESRCKAEIWFAHHAGDLFVVTPPETWRAEAVRQGLTRARLWVGEYGVWTRADGAFREAPMHMASAALEEDARVRSTVLAQLAEKYAEAGWNTWGPRFKKGLADGSRVMIRYRPDG